MGAPGLLSLPLPGWSPHLLHWDQGLGEEGSLSSPLSDSAWKGTPAVQHFWLNCHTFLLFLPRSGELSPMNDSQFFLHALRLQRVESIVFDKFYVSFCFAEEEGLSSSSPIGNPDSRNHFTHTSGIRQVMTLISGGRVT